MGWASRKDREGNVTRLAKNEMNSPETDVSHAICSYFRCFSLFRSETDHLQSRTRNIRIFCVRVQMKNEACLVEATPADESISSQLRSRGCYVIQQVRDNRLFLWYGSKCTTSLKKSATVAAKMMRNR